MTNKLSRSAGGVFYPNGGVDYASETVRAAKNRMSDITTPYVGASSGSVFTSIKELRDQLLPVPRPLVSNYEVDHRDMMAMLADGRVLHGLQVLKAPIIQAEWSVDGSSTEIENFIEAVLKPLDHRLRKNSLSAIEWGHAPFEIVWEMRDVTVPDPDKPSNKSVVKDALIPVRIEPRLPWEVEYAFDPRSQKTLGFRYLGPEQMFGSRKKSEIPPLLNNDREWKAFWFTHDEAGVWNNPYGKSILDRAFKSWAQLENGGVLWEIYMHTKAEPLLVGTAPMGQIYDEDGQLVNAQVHFANLITSDLQRGGIIMRPSDFTEGDSNKDKYGLEYLLDDRRGEVFKDYLQHWTSELLVSLLLPGSNTIDNPSELVNRLKFEVQQLIYNDWIEAVNERIIAPLVRFNFGNKAHGHLIGKDLTGKRAEVYERLLQLMLQFLPANRREDLTGQVDFPAVLDLMGVPQMSAEEQEKTLKTFSRIAAGGEIEREDEALVRAFFAAMQQ